MKRCLDDTGRGAAFVALAIFLLTVALFAVGVQHPGSLNFDEAHYVPLARRLLAGDWGALGQHPPLGTAFIALGMRLFGDTPVGWRAMSVVFGALTVSGLYACCWLLVPRIRLAAWAAALTVTDHLVFVQARIAMLDTFMMGWMTWGLAAALAVARWQCLECWLAYAVCMGFAIGCKWFAVVGWVATLGWLLFAGPRRLAWVARCAAAAALTGLVYASTFVPYLSAQGGGMMALLHVHLTLYAEQLRVTQAHPYASGWWQWPLLLRPMWYAFEPVAGAAHLARCVFFVGNPLTMVGGLLALAVCFVRARHDAAARWVVWLYGVFLFSWLVIARKVAFYYYYYPAACMLSLAWALALRQSPRLQFLVLTVATLLFVYYYPVLAAKPVDLQSLAAWAWFTAWY